MMPLISDRFMIVASLNAAQACRVETSYPTESGCSPRPGQPQRWVEMAEGEANARRPRKRRSRGIATLTYLARGPVGLPVFGAGAGEGADLLFVLRELGGTPGVDHVAVVQHIGA